MEHKRIGVETLSELQIWIEGQFALVAQAQTTTAEDVRQVRSRVHDLGNDLAKLLALDIDGKFKRLEDTVHKHDTDLVKFTKESDQRRGMVTALKSMYVVGGAAAGVFATIAFRLYEVFNR